MKWETSDHYEYDPAQNGKYPFRDADGKTMGITSIAKESHTSSNGKTYSFDQVKPFVRKNITEAERMQLYSGLSRVEFEEKHKQHPDEDTLVGQSEVIFNRDYNDECMGVYGGDVLKAGTEQESSAGDAYTLAVRHPNIKEHQFTIVGRNILALMNTKFDYDDDHK